MTELTSYALRLPHEYKAAASALKALASSADVWTAESQTQPVTVRMPASMNAAILYLARNGILPTIVRLAESLDIHRDMMKPWQEIVSFLTANPQHAVAICEDFPEGSPAHAMLLESDDGDGEEANGERATRGWTVPMADALMHFSWHQKAIAKHGEAVRALQAAWDVDLASVPNAATKRPIADSEGSGRPAKPTLRLVKSE